MYLCEVERVGRHTFFKSLLELIDDPCVWHMRVYAEVFAVQESCGIIELQEGILYIYACDRERVPALIDTIMHMKKRGKLDGERENVYFMTATYKGK